MAEGLAFDSLVHSLHQVLDTLPDYRRGQNIQYTVQEAALGAFAVFFTQAPSFLAYQRTMQQAKGRSNADTLFGLHHIPCENQIRTLLDPVDPAQLFPVFEGLYDALDQAGQLSSFRTCAGQLLIALDGTEYFASPAIHCDRCSQRTSRPGRVTYFHQVITPVIVAPGKAEVIALPPEFITSQAGHEKQDGEQQAGKRWRTSHAGRSAPVPFLGDDLYGKQPFCELVVRYGCNFIFVCTPESHKPRYEWIDGLATAGELQQFAIRRWNGRFHELYTYRYANEVPWRDGQDALWVNWCELTMTKTADGTIVSRHAFATTHPLDRTTLECVVRAGRARWKIEHENTNILKTKGYHLEHNYGHGKHHLSAV